MTNCSEPPGGVPYSKAQISLSVPQTPASIIRSLTSVGDEIFGSGWSMIPISFLLGVTAMAFMSESSMIPLAEYVGEPDYGNTCPDFSLLDARWRYKDATEIIS